MSNLRCSASASGSIIELLKELMYLKMTHEMGAIW